LRLCQHTSRYQRHKYDPGLHHFILLLDWA
jgi:hypothetical protein